MTLSHIPPNGGKYLNSTDFARAIDLCPIVAIDFLVTSIKEDGSFLVLLGKRKNPPAKNFWFTPGGRVRKGESISAASTRIFNDEFGINLTKVLSDRLSLVGLFDHFYDDSPLAANLSSHYVDVLYSLSLTECPEEFLEKIKRQNNQHDEWKWVSRSISEKNNMIHPYVEEMISYFKKINHLSDWLRDF